MEKKRYILSFIVLAILIIAGFFWVKNAKAPIDGTNSAQNIKNDSQDLLDNNQSAMDNNQEIQIKQTTDPIDNAFSRITKKPFGINIDPKTSPVQPERFRGYHTGVDFETTSEEQNMDVPVKALCDGQLLSVRFVGGYGGVAIQSCKIEGQDVTVVYGHIRLSSVTAKTGDYLRAGDFLANLGTGFTSETDGERKHLHLGIHKGTATNILGYVQSKNELSAWIDLQEFLNS